MAGIYEDYYSETRQAQESLLSSSTEKKTSGLHEDVRFKDTKEATREAWSSQQTMWIVLQTVITSLLCFAINFGIATLSFKGEEDPPLFGFPISMLTNYIVTCTLETTMNWCIGGSLMSLG